MSYATRKAAMIKAVEIATQLPIGQVIWTDQNTVRPAKPYIAVNLTNMRNIGREQVLAPNSNGAGEIITEKEFYLCFQAFSDSPPSNTAIDTEELLLNFSDWCLTESARQIFEPESLVFVEVVSGPNCASVAVNTNWETRSIMDIRMRMPWTMEDQQQGLIEAVSANVLIKNIDGSTVMSANLLSGTPYSPSETTLTGITITAIDTLFQTIAFTLSSTPYTMVYANDIAVSINGDSTKQVSDLLVGDHGNAVYFLYLSQNYLKSITVTRP